MTSTTIKLIPIKQLALSPLNVRKTQAGPAADAELKASIKADGGIKQNLLVYPAGKNKFLVHGGGRRLKQLKALIEEGALPADTAVPCKVETEEQAIISSTTENVVRANMHPADQYEAFAAMIEKGFKTTEIANQFGVTENLVQRRLKLAEVDPVLLTAFRNDELSLDALTAFTICKDRSRQVEIFEQLKSTYHGINAYQVRHLATEDEVSASDSVAQFVGVDAYTAAGGTVRRDLFSEADNVVLEDVALLHRLATEALNAEAEKLRGEWKWVDVHLSVTYDQYMRYGREYPLPVEPAPEDQAKLDALNGEIEQMEEIGEEAWTDEVQARWDQLHNDLEALSADVNRSEYTDEQRARAGCVVSIDHRGALRVETGLVHPDDKRQQVRSGGSETMSAEEKRKEAGVSNSLSADLRAIRHQNLQAHLASDYQTAFDAMLYSMIVRLPIAYAAAPIDISMRQAEVFKSREYLEDTVAAAMLEEIKSTLDLSWISLESPQDFITMSALPMEKKQALFAWATAQAVQQQLANDDHSSPVLEEIGRRCSTDVAYCWRPDAKNYWSRVPKKHALSVAAEVIGQKWADERRDFKKDALAASMEAAFREGADERVGINPETAKRTALWLPEGMAFESSDEQPQGEVENPEPDVLPAFLKTAAE
ncbi:ParB/RepB/Spo0J family partition protein [Martelella mediterranea]|uniref:ParB family chromosome partitioning protein n=1 Tax=Martelella mediterranea TaxID=293089 RepID=A0A4R3NLD9_9HYPH|nr:ParB/RepB/Spo0J family partition protein [Martelella mediterranea]TCT36067.1 ParB family chromosome partitioning protein [Martelella mediterranea]